jgi:hypothetical protein
VLRRRRRDGEDSPALDERGRDEQALDRGGLDDGGLDDDGLDDGGLDDLAGPWDISENYPPVERIDCGSLLIPVHEGFDVQINVAEDQGAWVAVVHGESGMQLQAFAAPRSGGLWDEVRNEIAGNIAESGGGSRETSGPFGPELAAEVPIGEEGEAEPQLQPVRFLGFNGPRWFLRGVISGPAATDHVLAAPFNALFSEVVVVRGDYPAPPREQLEIRLPEEARRALEDQLAQQGEDHPDWYLPDPFTRGPEITETR